MSFNFTKLDKDSVVGDLNTNFSTNIENQLGSITNTDLAGDAGITSDKLADKFGMCTLSFVVSSTTWGNNFSFQDTATHASAHQAILYPEFPGKEAYLCAVSVCAADYLDDSATGDEGECLIYLNDQEVAQVQFTDAGGTGTAVGYIKTGAGSSAFSGPLATLHQGDYLKISFHKVSDSGAGNPTAASVSVTLTLKVELVS